LKIIHKFEVALQLLVESIYRISILLYGVPFVHNYDGRLALLMNVAAYLYILLAHSLRRIYHYKRDVGPSYRSQRTKHRILLDALVDSALLPYACGVYQIELLSVELKGCVYRVSRRACHVADYYSLIA
jgi:hypothetical protein